MKKSDVFFKGIRKKKNAFSAFFLTVYVVYGFFRACPQKEDRIRQEGKPSCREETVRVGDSVAAHAAQNNYRDQNDDPGVVVGKDVTEAAHCHPPPIASSVSIICGGGKIGAKIIRDLKP